MPRASGDEAEALARLSAAPARRNAGVGMLALLGTMLGWTALAHPPSAPAWLAFLIAGSALSLYAAWAMWQATGATIVLTREAVFEEGGRLIARIEDIAEVDRGLFAFKPSNGFLLRLKTPSARAWAPGLWWRMGRRVGIGGVTPGGQGRAMADILSALLLERDRKRPA